MMSGKMRIAAVFLLIIPLQASIFSQTVHCSHAAAEKADYEASRVRSWDKLYHSYLRYSGCDDGSIAEGYSDSVVRLFAHHWDTLSLALPLFRADAGFHRFVLRHIDSTTKDDDLKLTRENAIHSCPIGGNEECIEIRKAAEHALRDSGTPVPKK